MPLQLLHTLRGHSDRVWCASWSPSGRALATCGGDKGIRIWLREGGEGEGGEGGQWVCKQVLEGTHTRTVRWVSWSPNGKNLASAGFDGITAIWENQNGEFECVATLEGHENEVKCVSWARGGTLLATCSRDKSVWIWAADGAEKEFECLSVLNGHTQDVKVAKFHPTNESELLSASYDNTIRVWSEQDDDWYCTQTLTGHASTVWSLTFSADGTRMASASDDQSIFVWQKSEANTSDNTTADENTTAATQGQSSWKLQGAFTGQHSRCIYTVDWSKAGLIASGAADDSICIFGPIAATTDAAAAATPVASFPAPAVAAAAAASAATNTTTAATAAATPALPAAAQSPPPGLGLLHTERSAHSGDVNCVSWNPVHTDLLASAGDDGVIKIWRFATP